MLKAVVAAVAFTGALGWPGEVVAQRAADASRQSECFGEGSGVRHCVELTLGCAAADTACLMDDLSGAILKARGDAEAKYAAYLARGEAARRARRLGDALADYEAAQHLQPRLATPHILTARVLMQAGEPRRALASLDEADRRAPELPAILLLRAGARRAMGDLLGAIDDLDRALAIARSGRALPEGGEEDLEVLLTARGEAHLARGDEPAARNDILAALAAKPDFAPARDALAKLGR